MTVSRSTSKQYEQQVHLVLGAAGGGVCVWQFSTEDGLTSRFSDADAHTGSVRACKFTSMGQLITSGDDGLIQIISVRKNSRVALLDGHEDQINDMDIVEEKSGFVHVMSASNDASIGIWGRVTGRWECKRRMRRHRGPVLALAAHPSGRLALTIGADGTLRTWNLVRGRLAFVVKLKSRPERAVDVQWSPDGERFFVEFPHRLDFYRVEAAQTLDCSISVHSGVSDAVFISSGILAVATGLQLLFRDVTKDGVEISSLTIPNKSDDGRRSKIRSLVWDSYQRLLFVLIRHSEGSELLVYRLPLVLISGIQSPTADALAVMLCRTAIPFRVTCMDARRFRIRSTSVSKKKLKSENKQSHPVKESKKSSKGNKSSTKRSAKDNEGVQSAKRKRIE